MDEKLKTEAIKGITEKLTNVEALVALKFVRMITASRKSSVASAAKEEIQRSPEAKPARPRIDLEPQT